MQKYRRLCVILDAILYLKDDDTFHEIITSKYLEDVIAALFQLAFAPVKKPITDDNDFTDFHSVSDDFEVLEMSSSLWHKLEENKNKYKNHLLFLQKQTYRPLLIRKYLVLLEAKVSCPLNVIKKLYQNNFSGLHSFPPENSSLDETKSHENAL